MREGGEVKKWKTLGNAYVPMAPASSPELATTGNKPNELVIVVITADLGRSTVRAQLYPLNI